MHLLELHTPSLILDKNRLDANIAHLSHKLSGSSAILRPHLKTSKSLDVAARIVDPGAAKITVSTLHEAEYFLKGGYRDILYAVSIAPHKLRQVKTLQDKGGEITLILDNIETARQLAEYGRQMKTVFPCLIEIDCDGKRAGLKPDNPAITAIAASLHNEAGTSLHGVMTHAGGSYYCQTQDQIREMAEQERLAITQAADLIRNEGLPCPIVSLGSTPTAYFAENFDGITEVRAGVYVFQDMVMEALQVCQTSDIALSVLATVISHKEDENRILIDAGSLALSADPGKRNDLGNAHFGKICDAEHCTPLSGLWVNSTNQEHGLVSLEHTDLTFADFPIGRRVRILPNHACITAAAYNGYHVIEADSQNVDYWERSNGW